MEIISHRGFSSERPENTIASFDYALESGFSYLELDIHLSKDGVLYVIHDDTVDRTTDGTGFIKNLNSHEINMLDAGSWFDKKYYEQKIPTLESILIRYQNKAHLFIELKSDSNELINTLRSLLVKYAWIQETHPRTNTLELQRVSIISFLPSQLLRSVALNPEINHGFLMIEPLKENIDFCLLNNINGFFPYVENLDQDIVDQVHKEGLFVGAWGFESLIQVSKSLEMGVDGITVDWPSKALEMILTED